MIHRQVLYGALPDGSNLHCLMGGGGGIDHWSADGRYHFNTSGQMESLVVGGESLGQDLTTVAAAEFNRPVADSDFYQVKSSGIVRYDFATKQETEISHTGEASDLTISPDGSLLAYVGFESFAGRAHLWTVSPHGGQPSSVMVFPSTPTANGTVLSSAVGLTFVSPSKLLYLQSNATINFDGPYQLMSLELGQKPKSLAPVGKPLSAAVSAGLVAADKGSPWVATAFGECTDGITTSVYDTSQSSVAAQAVPVSSSYPYVTPVGWLPDGRLALLARTDDCHGSGDLLLWKPGDSSTTLYASGVSGAAIRVPGNLQVPARITQ